MNLKSLLERALTPIVRIAVMNDPQAVQREIEAGELRRAYSKKFFGVTFAVRSNMVARDNLDTSACTAKVKRRRRQKASESGL